jgi:hypothetical protein
MLTIKLYRPVAPFATHGLVAGNSDKSSDAVPAQNVLGLGQRRLLSAIDQHCRSSE